MSWAAIIALGAACYALKAFGPLVLGPRTLDPGLDRLLKLLAVPPLAALVLVQTFATRTELTVDARVPAIGVAAVLVWLRAPFLVVVVAAAGTAALLRAVA